jgi:hypothetical protein
MGQFGTTFKRVPVFQQGAVCLTKFGPESGETADEILARKELERLSGVGAHKNEFWWGVGEKVIYKRVDFTFQRQFRFIFRD